MQFLELFLTNTFSYLRVHGGSSISHQRQHRTERPGTDDVQDSPTPNKIGKGQEEEKLLTNSK